MESLETKMLRLADALKDKKARGVTGIDVRGLASEMDAVLIASAKSPRHARALAEALLKEAGERGDHMLGMEGQRQGNWILVDLNEIVAHVFTPETRGFYNLEGLWRDAPEFDFGPEEDSADFDDLVFDDDED